MIINIMLNSIVLLVSAHKGAFFRYKFETLWNKAFSKKIKLKKMQKILDCKTGEKQ